MGEDMDLRKCKKRMDELIGQGKKKTKGYSKVESAEYNENLEQLLNVAGFSGEVLPYIAGAVEICGLNGLVRWLKAQETPCERLREFLESKDFRDSKANAQAGILFSALKSCITEREMPRECAGILLAAVPAACRTKNGSWLSSIHKIFQKSFFEPLSFTTELPPADELGLDQDTVAAIREMAETIHMKMLEENKIRPDGEKQRKVFEWLGKKYPENDESVSPQVKMRGAAKKGKAPEVPATAVPQKNEANGIVTLPPQAEAVACHSPKKPVSAQHEESPARSILSLNEKVSGLLAEIGRYAQLSDEKTRKLEEENSKFRSDLASKTRDLEDSRKASDALRRDIAEKSQEIDELKAEIKRLEADYAHFRNESTEKLSRKDEDLERFQQVIREHERQKDVFRNRLAKALRTDYQEFLEAADSDEMTPEMGTAILTRLEQIFRILRENGINPGENA